MPAERDAGRVRARVGGDGDDDEAEDPPLSAVLAQKDEAQAR